MPPKRTPAQISSVMRRVKSSNTAPEQLLRRALAGSSTRLRRNAKSLPGKPDLVIHSRRLAIFVDGDFWHGNQWRRRKLRSLDEQFGQSSRKKSTWTKKIRRNMQRDASATFQLLSSGWNVLRFWERDVITNLQWCVEQVKATRNPDPLLAQVASKTFAEFFAGIGLVRMGLEQEGWTCAFANDFDPDKKELYDANFGVSEHFKLEDIHKLKASSVPAVSLATASFPCNDLSLAGARRGLDAKHSSAFWGFTRILRSMGAKRPAIVLLENVPGFITSHDGKDFCAALIELNELGYVVDPFLLDASFFVPQSRLRLFVVAIRTDLPHSIDSPNPNFESESLIRPKLLSSFIKKHPEILWYLRSLPSPPVRKATLPEILEDLPAEAPEWWSEERKRYLFEQFSERHRAEALDMIRRRKWSYGTVFRRIRNERSMAELRTDGIAGCLRTPRGGSGRQILFQAGYGDYSARLLTPRECARLMGADSFRLAKDVPVNKALFGFGDAVCVPAIEWIARHYLNPIISELLRSQPHPEQVAAQQLA
jgi:DNA (cytosine-5)-methyltransferase 1